MNWIQRNKSSAIVAIYMMSLAFYFWTSSRYPALNEKLLMGTNSDTEGLAFSPIFSIHIDHGFFERILYQSLNWAHTNLHGMTFGLLFAGAAMTLLAKIDRGSLKNHSMWIETLKGTAFGVPLGICANCISPVARGLHEIGQSHFRLSAMTMSSPTLNIYVIAMTFALLPFHIAWIKIAATLTLIFIVVPIALKLSGSNSQPAVTQESKDCNAHEENVNWNTALLQSLTLLIKNTFRVILWTVPAMLLAGIIGSMIIEILPFGYFAQSENHWFFVALAALVGGLLPVPIAFDVITSAALFKSGLPISIVTAFLITMGPISLYSMIIFKKIIGLRRVLIIYFCVAFIGISFAFLASRIDQNTQSNQLAFFYNLQEKKQVQISEKVRKLCENEGDNETRCQNDLLFYASLILAQPDTCQWIEDSIERQSCIKNANILSIRINPDICNKSKEKTAGCLRDLALHLPFTSPFVSERACQWYSKNNEFQKSCALIDRIQSSLQNTDQSKKCAVFDDSKERKICKKANTFRLARRKSSLKLCENLADPLVRIQCVYSIMNRINTAQEIIENCKGDCRHNQAVYAGIKESDNSLCNDNPTCLFAGNAFRLQTFINEVDNLSYDEFLTKLTSSSRLDLSPTGQIRELIEFKKNSISVTQVKINDFIESYKFRKSKTQKNNRFNRVIASKVGVKDLPTFNSLRFLHPINRGHGVAAEDVDNDQFVDLLVGSENGLRLFINESNGSDSIQFQENSSVYEKTKGMFVLAVALVDINNDDWVDIYFTTYGGDNYYLLNDQHWFKNSHLASAPSSLRVSTRSIAFHDINHDGFMDVALGNWTSVFPPYKNESSINEVHIFKDNKFSKTKTAASYGETLTTLFFDFDGDLEQDLYYGNANLNPDRIYSLKSSGSKSDLITPFPQTSKFTMSIDIGDINNDLIADVFMTDMSFEDDYGSYCREIQTQKDRTNCETQRKALNAINNYDWSGCQLLETQILRAQCNLSMIAHLAIYRRKPELCRFLNSFDKPAATVCHNHFNRQSSRYLASDNEMQQKTVNTLIVKKSLQSPYKIETDTYGVAKTNWSWNARFNDLDNDGWQDLYVSNGNIVSNRSFPNVFFHNQSGNGFVESQKKFNLDVLAPTPSFVQADFDLDGDLDLFNFSTNSPPLFLVNEGNNNHSVSFSLRDPSGNSRAVGANVTIESASGQKQRKWIYLGGGYYSFNPTTVHFGLGEEALISKVIVEWPNQTRTEIHQNLPSGHHYIIQNR